MNTISCNGTSLSYVVCNPDESKDMILLLHGGSKTLGKGRFTGLQDRLAKQSIASLAFDFSGVGDSSGDMSDTSLEQRVREAQCVTQFTRKKFSDKNFSVYGVSMGGYIALGLVDTIPDAFEKLILHAPAAYAQEAHSLKFNSEFTDVLNENDSWKSSQSFSWLDNFEGEVLFISSKDDTVIPDEVLATYRSIIEKKTGATMLTIAGMKHNIWDKKGSGQNRKQVSDKIITFLKR